MPQQQQVFHIRQGSVFKFTRSQRLGFQVIAKKKRDAEGRTSTIFHLHKINPYSAMALWTPLQEGMRVLAINHEPCPKSIQELKEVLENSIGFITIHAVEHDDDYYEEEEDDDSSVAVNSWFIDNDDDCMKYIDKRMISYSNSTTYDEEERGRTRKPSFDEERMMEEVKRMVLDHIKSEQEQQQRQQQLEGALTGPIIPHSDICTDFDDDNLIPETRTPSQRIMITTGPNPEDKSSPLPRQPKKLELENQDYEISTEEEESRENNSNDQRRNSMDDTDEERDRVASSKPRKRKKKSRKEKTKRRDRGAEQPIVKAWPDTSRIRIQNETVMTSQERIRRYQHRRKRGQHYGILNQEVEVTKSSTPWCSMFQCGCSEDVTDPELFA